MASKARRPDGEGEEAPARAKRHRVEEAPAAWAELPPAKLTLCIGNRDADRAVSLINSATRCPTLTAYDLRWRRHMGGRPGPTRPELALYRPLLNNSDNPAVPPWPGLGVELTEGQRRSLHWMLSKEAGTDDELVVERGCEDCRFSTHRGIDFQLRLSFTLCGGILADAMGYGKTLLAIALIAANCAEQLPARAGRAPCGATLVFVPDNLVCQWLREFKKLLGTAVDARFFAPGDAFAADPAAGGAGDSQKSGAFEGAARPCEAGASAAGAPPPPLPPGAVAAAAATATAAAEPNGVGEEATGGADWLSGSRPESTTKAFVYAVACSKGWAEMMQAPWMDALAVIVPYTLLHNVEPWLVLHRHHWRRVVVDELHEALASETMAGALSVISAQHVWGLSGTLPCATAGDVAQLAALFGVLIPIDEVNAGRFLDCYVRKNDVPSTIVIPIDEHCSVIRPAPLERAIYLACQHDFDRPMQGPEAHAGYVPAFLSTWRGLQEHGREAALVKLCCHHQITSTDAELLSTPAQSVARLRIWKRHHCEEARRLIRQHAVLAEWMRRGSRPAEGCVEDCPAWPDAQGGASEQEAWAHAAAEVAWANGLDNEGLLAACRQDLETMPFALCDCPMEAEARWLRWCEEAGLKPGTRGAISRLRKIMYNELWGRLVDGLDGWEALAKMAGRNWRADYAAAQRSRLLEAVADYASSLQSARFLESAAREALTLKELECGICLQTMQAPRMTPCAHLFCKSCIERSVEAKAECPHCRAPVHGPADLSAFDAFDEMLAASQAAVAPADTGGEQPTMVGSTSGSSSSSSGSSLASASSSSSVVHGFSSSSSSSSIGSSNSSSSSRGLSAPLAPGQILAREGEFGSKISALVKQLDVIRRAGEKAVVFAQWQDLIFKIQAALATFGIPAAVLAGGAFDRASILQRFESPDLPVLLLSLEDSASGTNMTHANHVLLVHPMVAGSAEEQHAYEAQAIGRVRRWGQRRRVQVYRFVVQDTIEADLAAAQHAA